MAFMEKLGESLKAGLQDTLTSETVSENLGTVLKQSIGSAFMDTPAEQLGANQFILDEEQRRRQAAAEAAKAAAQKARFIQEETLKSSLRSAEEAKKFKAQQGVKEATEQRTIVVEAIKAAGTNSTGIPSDDKIKIEQLVKAAANIITPEGVETLFNAHKNDKNLTTEVRRFNTFNRLKKQGVIPKDMPFMKWEIGRFGPNIAQEYFAYEQDAIANGKTPIPYEEFYMLRGSSSKSGKDADKNESYKYSLQWLKDAMGGDRPMSDFAKVELGPDGEPIIVGANAIWRKNVDVVKKFDPNIQISANPNAQRVREWVAMFNRKQKGKNQSKSPSLRQQNAQSSSSVMPGNLIRNVESNALVQEFLPTIDGRPNLGSISDKVKPSNFNPDDKTNYVPALGMDYIGKVDKSLAAIAKVKKYDISFLEAFGLNKNQFEEFKGLYTKISQNARDKGTVEPKDSQRLAALTRIILNTTLDSGSVRQTIEKTAMPKRLAVARSEDLTGSGEFKIIWDNNTVNNLSILAKAVGVEPKRLDLDVLKDSKGQNLSDKGVKFVSADGTTLTMFGRVAGVNPIVKKNLQKVSSRLMNTPEHFKMYKNIWNFQEGKDSDFKNNQEMLAAKLQLVENIALQGDKGAPDLIVTEALLDVLLKTDRTYSTTPRGNIVATANPRAAFLSKDFTTELGETIKRSTGPIVNEMRKTVTGQQNLDKAGTRVTILKSLIKSVINGNDDGIVKISEDGTTVDNFERTIQKITPADAAAFNEDSITGVVGSMRNLASGAKLLVEPAVKLFTDIFGVANDSIKLHSRLSTGFGINTDAKDSKFVQSNQQFIESGLGEAITRETKILNKEYDILQERKAANTLTQRELDLYLVRRKVLWEKIALTYTLAGYVQGDQAGGRTISNEDFAIIREALWGGAITESTTSLIDMINHLDITLTMARSKSRAGQIRLAIFGIEGVTDTGSLTSTIIERQMERSNIVSKREGKINADLRKQTNNDQLTFEEAAQQNLYGSVPNRQEKPRRTDEPYKGYLAHKNSGRLGTVYDELLFLYQNSKTWDGKEGYNVRIAGGTFEGIEMPNYTESQLFLTHMNELYAAKVLVDDFESNGHTILENNNDIIPTKYLEAINRLDSKNIKQYPSLALLYGLTDFNVKGNYFGLELSGLRWLKDTLAISKRIPQTSQSNTLFNKNFRMLLTQARNSRI